MLGGAGYEVRLMEGPEAFEVADPLAGDERRGDFLRAMARTLEAATIPVPALSPGPEGALAAEDWLVPFF